MQSTVSRNTYDQVPYPSHPLPQTHPDHLATLATLLGLNPPPLNHCRVLELGCASGGNLIPMALSLPGSTFIGVDMSAQQIDDGRQTVDALELTNIELRHLSIVDVDQSFGSFDYIICHGVYSWVPPQVQEKILSIIQHQLVPNGVGYVSYNTHPGWHLRGLIRHMMGYHVSRYPDDSPEMSINRARRLLDFLERAAPDRDQAYSALLKEQAQLLRLHSDSYLFHEHLEEHNEPIWFLDFCERLATHRLRYLAEAEFGMMIAGISFAPEVQRELEELAPNLLEKEQYMDFVRNRSFRQTLICHDHLRPNYDIRSERITEFYVASPVRPVAEPPNLKTESPENFASDGLSVESATPIVKAALLCLGEAWPGAIPFDSLVTVARARLERDAGAGNEVANEQEIRVGLARALLTMFATSNGALLRLSLRPPLLATSASERPLASPLARLQAQQGRPIANLRHESVTMAPFDTHLLPLLDGTRDNAALLEGLMDRFRQGVLSISQDQLSVTDECRAGEILHQMLIEQIPKLARAALLVDITA
jgi:methyltransferase-like protein